MQPTHTPAREPDAHPATPVALTPATYLRGAGLYLVRHGWRQGDMFACLSDDDKREGLADTDKPTPFPAACALGAIRMAVFGTAAITVDTAASCAFSLAVGVFADHLVNAYGVADPSDAVTSRSSLDLEEIVTGWNDDPARIASHVIAALSMAAAAWDRLHPVHVDYPHEPGTLYDCPACESRCHCTRDFECVACALDTAKAEAALGGAE